MLIGNKYRVESDSMNITLYKKRISKKIKSKDGKNTRDWEVVGYFSSYQGLLTHLVNHDIKGLGLDDIKLITQRQTELFQLITSLLQPLQDTRKALKG